MKKINKIVTYLAFTLLVLLVSGCSDDNKNYTVEVPEIHKEIVLSQSSAKVKVGADHKLILDIISGNRNYKAFSLNDEILDVQIEGNKVTLQGYQNGSTSVIITDNYNTISKIPVQVYTTDILEIEHSQIELTTLLGYSGSIKTAVKLGNGGYTISADNKLISATITEGGEIEISSTSEKEVFSGIVTVQDCSGLSADIQVSVLSRTSPIYLPHEIEAIKANNTDRYYFNGRNILKPYHKKVNKVDDNNKYTYGWNYYGESSFFICFTGDNSIGVKDGATLEQIEWYESTGIKDIYLEIVDSNEESIWGIYSYLENEILNFGYFCTKIAK